MNSSLRPLLLSSLGVCALLGALPAHAAGNPAVVRADRAKGGQLYEHLRFGKRRVRWGTVRRGLPKDRPSIHERPAKADWWAMVAAIAGDLGGKGNALLFINGFGGTPAMELYLMYNAAARQLAKHGLAPVRALVGSYVTSLDMAGCSITVTLLDDEAAKLWDAPVHTPALRWGM